MFGGERTRGGGYSGAEECWRLKKGVWCVVAPAGAFRIKKAAPFLSECRGDSLTYVSMVSIVAQ